MPVPNQELERLRIQQLEKAYAPETIRLSNQLLLSRNRLRQIDNWRSKALSELERRVTEKNEKKALETN